MKRTTLAVIWITACIIVPARSNGAEGDFSSPYAGQEKREIKTFSEADIDDLRNGRGWGLAKAAELNGVPGPRHLLEMKEEIGLTPDQVKQVEGVYKKMKGTAISLGNSLIDRERELNRAFADRTIDDTLLREMLDGIAAARKDLRFIHLAAHLEVLPLLKEEQIALYNRLRGYDSQASPDAVPAGHDPEMWRRHNQ